MTRDALIVAILWAFLTIVGEVIAISWDYLPLAAAREAQTVDDAFRVLVFLAVPVFAFVVAAVVYSSLRFRRRAGLPEDGPPIRSNGPVVATWFLVTTALTILLIIFPGTTGLLELRGHTHATPDVVPGGLSVQVQGSRWTWKITYPQQNVVIFNELVLPVGQPVRFDVTATDVIHSFWVPAFRMKVDAVPGRVTTVEATPTRTGIFEEDSGFRVQCAELCGLGHGLMVIPVRVVEPDEFQAWVAQSTSSTKLIR